MVVRKRILIIYNPKSGLGGARRTLKKVTDHLESTCSLSTHNVQEKEYTHTLLKDAEILILIGGDGTLRNLISALQKYGLKRPILLIPRGSANVVAKSLELPITTNQSLKALKKNKSILVDIAQLDDKTFFVVGLSMGYMSDRIIDTSRKLKRRIGLFSYLVSFMKQRKLPVHTYRFSIDSTTYEERGHSLFIVNTTNVFGFGSSRTTSYMDGIFELVVTKNKSFWSMIGLTIDFYFSRRSPKHFFLEKGTDFIIHAENDSCLQIDGDEIQSHGRSHIRVLKNAQEFIK